MHAKALVALCPLEDRWKFNSVSANRPELYPVPSHLEQIMKTVVSLIPSESHPPAGIPHLML